MKYAMVFPGQGSQSVGMLGALDAPEVAATFSEASSALGWDVATLVKSGPEAQLNRTEFTQPALLAAGIAVWRVWRKQDQPSPVALAGHSLGEYTALVAAGSLEFADALKLVQLRGKLMQAAVPEGTGGMAAMIGLDDAGVEKLCAGFGGGVLEPVNYNAPGQIVVAGERAGLEWLEANAKAAGARMVMRLPVSVPSHCSLMKGAADKLADRLAQVTVRSPSIPVHQNLDAKARANPDEIRRALHQQLFRPVRWTSTIQGLAQQGVGLFLECGPGKVLTGLTKRIAPTTKFLALEDPAMHAQARSLIAS
ncbi:MAG TPA: ACP S-malonyltransferase [Nevskiaceae bacterium]|nr:ACP S-malonyltransferase [Nevskiaceae bacterium]